MSATAVASVVQDIPKAQSSGSRALTPVRAAGLKTNYIQQIKDQLLLVVGDGSDK